MTTATVDKRSQQKESVRAEVRAWILAKAAKEAEVELPDLAKEAIKHFSKDGAFVQQLFEESLYDLVYDLAQKVLKTTRILNLPEGPHEPDAAPPKSIFARWMEHAGTRHVAVLNMTKEDLKLAEAERRERGDHEIAVANLWKYLYSHMKASDEIVADRFTTAQIETLYRRFVSGETK